MVLLYGEVNFHQFKKQQGSLFIPLIHITEENQQDSAGLGLWFCLCVYDQSQLKHSCFSKHRQEEEVAGQDMLVKDGSGSVCLFSVPDLLENLLFWNSWADESSKMKENIFTQLPPPPL